MFYLKGADVVMR